MYTPPFEITSKIIELISNISEKIGEITSIQNSPYLGTQEGNTVKEVFDLCEKITGQKISITIRGRREGDPAKLVADNTKSIDVLKWKPEKTLNDSIDTAYRWERLLNKELVNA